MSAAFAWLRKAATDREMRGMFSTLVLIFLDCWDGQTICWSAPTSAPVLAKGWNMSRITAWRHISQLEALDYIEIRNIVHGTIRIRPKGMFHKGNERFINALEEVGINSINQENLKEVEPTTVSSLKRFTDETEVDQNLRAVLVHHGVVGGALGTLLSLRHVNIEYVEAHFKRVALSQDEGKGLAISRMFEGAPVPIFCRVCNAVDGKHGMVFDEDNEYIACPLGGGWDHLTDEDILEMHGEIRPEIRYGR